MRTFLVSVKETKYFVINTDEEDPILVAEQFVAFDGNNTMRITLSGVSPQEIEISELSEPSSVLDIGDFTEL
jgi:hypothetical protein